MHRRRLIRGLAAPLVAAAAGPFARVSAVNAQDSDWVPLFNGRDLAGWETFLGRPHSSTPVAGLARDADGTYLEVVGVDRDPRGVFRVVALDEAPAIRISGEIYGALVTRAAYGDYHLRFQFRWGDTRWPPRPLAPRDTGCCYHSTGPHGASYGFWMQSCEFQIQEGDVGDFYSLAGVKADVRATMVDPANPKSDLRFDPEAPAITATTRRVIKARPAEHPHGAWNTLDLYCLGQTSVHVVNGQVQLVLTGLRRPVSGADDEPLTRGRIQLQSEAAEVYVRALAIRSIRTLPSWLSV